MDRDASGSFLEKSCFIWFCVNRPAKGLVLHLSSYYYSPTPGLEMPELQ